MNALRDKIPLQFHPRRQSAVAKNFAPLFAPQSQPCRAARSEIAPYLGLRSKKIRRQKQHLLITKMTPKKLRKNLKKLQKNFEKKLDVSVRTLPRARECAFSSP
jgi:hypothetical protein